MAKTAAEKKHLSRLASLGCIVCSEFLGIYDSPAEIHHLTGAAGLGKKASHFQSIGLCAPHHRIGGNGIAFHSTVKKVWEDTFDTQENLLELVNERLSA